MDFSFFIGFTRDTGIRLFDIKYKVSVSAQYLVEQDAGADEPYSWFKGERIIYELGLMEAIAHYAGKSVVVAGPGAPRSLSLFLHRQRPRPEWYCLSRKPYASTSFYMSLEAIFIAQYDTNMS